MKETEADTDRHFRTDHLESDLKQRSVRGGAATMAAQVGRYILNAGSLVILARLLTPTDFGLIAMVAAVTSFVSMFKDMGLSMATVQRADVSHGQVNALFWVNVALSLTAMAITAALAPAVAWFYEEPRLASITLALAGGIFLGGLAVQHEAILKRQMRFTALAGIEVAAVLGSIGAAIGAAWLGAGYWALVLQQLVQAGLRTAIVWVLCRWRPSRPAWAKGARSMLAFGGNLTGFQVVNYFARNADDVLIGRYVGAEPLGLYNKAYKLLLAPIELIRGPISNVVLPSLSRLQTKPERYRNYFTKALSVIVFLSMPLVTFCYAESDRIILLILGPQWTESARLFRVLAVAAFIQTFNMTTGWSYISLGQTHRWLRWGIVSATVIVAGFVVGLPWGAYGVAVSYVVTNYLVLLPGFLYCFHTSHMRTSDIFRTIWRPALAAIAAAALVVFANQSIPWEGGFITHLVASGLFFSLAYLLCWLLLPGGLSYLTELRGLVLELKNR